MIVLDPKDVVAARTGNRAALNALIQSAERPIFNLAIRMLADRAEAEDSTQEILIKIFTNLGSLKDPAAAGGWALKIATRHLVQLRKRNRIESTRLTFAGFAEDLQFGQVPIEQAELSEAEKAVAIDQVKVGCTLALLTCLTRNLRIAYILGEIFEMVDTEAAEALEISAQSYRQRLKRARASVVEFTQATCGILGRSSACDCKRRVVPALRSGRIEGAREPTGSLAKAPVDLEHLRAEISQLEADQATAALMRSNPDYDSQIGKLVLSVLERN